MVTSCCLFAHFSESIGVDILNYLVFCLMFLFYVNGIPDFILICKNNKKTKAAKLNDENTKVTLKPNLVMFFLALIVFFSCFIYLMFLSINSNYFLFYFIGFIILIVGFLNTLKDANVLSPIVFGGSDVREFSNKEKLAIYSICGFIFAFNFYFPFEKGVNFIISLNISILLKEIIVSFVLILLYFVLTSLIFILAFLPVRKIRINIDKLYKKFDHICTSITNNLVNRTTDFILFDYFLSKYISFFRSSNIILKILCVPLIVFAFALDFYVTLSRLILVVLTVVFILTLFEILRISILLILKIFNFVTIIPDGKFLRDTVRIALIFSVTFLVINIRFETYFVFDEAFSGVIEFVASAIVIPLIFEWINSKSEIIKEKVIKSNTSSNLVLNNITTDKTTNRTSNKSKNNSKNKKKK